MRVHGLFARFVTVGVMLLAGVGTAQLAPSAAGAAPGVNYPPPPPSLTVNVGTVVVNQSVTVAGRGYRRFELVVVYTRYGPGFSRPTAAMIAGKLRLPPGCGCVLTLTDSKGSFRAKIRLTRTGTATITAVGLLTHERASATVLVLARNRRPPPRHAPGPGLAGRSATTAALARPFSWAMAF